jgi:hypothetical protein
MIYKNFDEHITRKHGIIIEGWPLPLFDNPSAIGSQVELNVLLRAWQTGATRFHKITEDEYMTWMESRAPSEPSPTSAAGPPPPEEQSQDSSTTPPTNPPVVHAMFNIISLELESASTPQASKNMPKKPRKTRSDKGKPRKKPSQLPGANIFYTDMQ